MSAPLFLFFTLKKTYGILPWVIQWGGKILGSLFKPMALPYPIKNKIEEHRSVCLQYAINNMFQKESIGDSFTCLAPHIEVNDLTIGFMVR